MFRLYETLSSGLLVIGCLSLCVASALYLPGVRRRIRSAAAEVDDNGTAAQRNSKTPCAVGQYALSACPDQVELSAIAVQNYTGSDTTNPLHPENLVEIC